MSHQPATVSPGDIPSTFSTHQEIVTKPLVVWAIWHNVTGLTAQPYQDRRRMTLTYPALDRARSILWLVTGASKRDMLVRLQQGDAGIPAGRVQPERALVLADRHAAGQPG